MFYTVSNRDLVLYHGGSRPMGVVCLDYRQTGEGEGIERVRALRDLPAVWSAGNVDDAKYYATAANARDLQQHRAWGGSIEHQIYYLDVPQATVAKIEFPTSYNITDKGKRLQWANDAVNAAIAEVDPDVLDITRANGDREFIIRDKAKARVTRVVGWQPRGKPSILDVEQLAVDIPLTDKQGECLPSAPPSEAFCQIMQQQWQKTLAETNDDGHISQVKRDYAQRELDYWRERCDEFDEGIGGKALDRAISQTEQLRDNNFNKESRAVLAERLKHWQSLQAAVSRPAVVDLPVEPVYAGEPAAAAGKPAVLRANKPRAVASNKVKPAVAKARAGAKKWKPGGKGR